MGMAASQARLLCITARLHDVEYEAQSIENAKLQLSTQSDQVYNDYLAALDAETLTLTAIDTKSGTKSTIAATFNNLFSASKLTAADGSNYALKDSNGRLIVSDDVYDAYTDFMGNGEYASDPYEFAMYMCCPDYTNDSEEFSSARFTSEESLINDSNNTALIESYEALQSYASETLGITDTLEYTDYISPANSFEDWSSYTNEEKDGYLKLLDVFKNKMYTNYSDKIYSGITGEESNDFDTDSFNYYVSIFRQIQSSNGCRPISDFNGPDGNAASNSEWLTAMIQSGQLSLETVTTNKKTGEITMDGTSPSSDVSLSYTDTTSIDSTAAAKAEAKYEHDLKEIDKKDKKYDLTLSKLETERSALTTEYDSVKKVIEDNIERTFGIFS